MPAPSSSHPVQPEALLVLQSGRPPALGYMGRAAGLKQSHEYKHLSPEKVGFSKIGVLCLKRPEPRTERKLQKL